MCSTPAPPLTAWVAATIWSGTGEAAMHRLVARAATRDDSDFARLRTIAADDHLVGVVHTQLGVRGLDADQGLGDDGGRVVDQLLHIRPLSNWYEQLHSAPGVPEQFRAPSISPVARWGRSS